MKLTKVIDRPKPIIAEACEHNPQELFKNGGLDKNTFLLFDYYKIKNPEKDFFKYKIIIKGVKFFTCAWLMVLIGMIIYMDKKINILPSFALFIILTSLCIHKAYSFFGVYVYQVLCLKREIGDLIDYSFFGERHEELKELMSHLQTKKNVVIKDNNSLMGLMNVPDLSPHLSEGRSIKTLCKQLILNVILILVIYCLFSPMSQPSSTGVQIQALILFAMAVFALMLLINLAIHVIVHVKCDDTLEQYEVITNWEKQKNSV